MYRPRLLLVLPLLFSATCATAQNTGGGLLPVRVWFEYKGTLGHPFGYENAAAVRDAVAKALEPGCAPYAFVGGATREQSHLRITLTREDTETLSLNVELYNFDHSAANQVGGVVTYLGQVPSFQKRYSDSLPNSRDWPVKVANAITQVEFIRTLKKSLHDFVPFAKGIQLIKKVPPAPINKKESGIAILVELNSGYANGGSFEVEYGDDARRLVTIADGCRRSDGRIVVVPEKVMIKQKPENASAHYGDYLLIAPKSAEILIYPAADFHGGSGTVNCTAYVDYVTPKPKQIQ